MKTNATDFLAGLFGQGKADSPPAPTPEAADPLATLPFADWVLRPDAHGRIGWEAPGLPEVDRWWARCDFLDLPVVPEGFRLGDIQEPAPRIAPYCDSGGMVDVLYLGGKRPLQRQPEGFGGA
ncbi:MAG: hypothetical protein KKA28_17900 [Planctomycetes bacterium]|nr:hypothetical protein [Planctomycetota bacterium]MCG2682715.1 hypothetical protein [Planctomycetales bacterium]